MNILVNALGVKDSGGLRVLRKFLSEVSTHSVNNYYIVCFKSNNIFDLKKKYSKKNIFFILSSRSGIWQRLYYENFYFRKIVESKNINLIYNFSGTYQFFLSIPQILKIQNLMFYCKKLDNTYFKKKYYFLWFKQVFIKRLFLNFMLNKCSYIEVQSSHVIDNLSPYLSNHPREFFIKSDIDVSSNLFHNPKNYNFNKTIKFLFVVGPHFEDLHKNFTEFVNAMISLDNQNLNFEINITLSRVQLEQSKNWDVSLNSKTNFLGYISDEKLMNNQYCDNTILISTSIIETLGLPVIEAIKNGIYVITPDEVYATSVYGDNVIKYELFNYDSLQKTIMALIKSKDLPSKRISSSQRDLRQGEMLKYKSSVEMFSKFD
jgi:hypothetical protein